MKEKGYHPQRARGTAIGVDVGATLAKLVVRTPDEALRFDLVPAPALAALAERIASEKAECIGATGGGAGDLVRLLDDGGMLVNEFAAWGAGSAALLRSSDGGNVETERHLVVSVGTGTSVMLVDGLAVTRVGGTALGGGTVVGLGALLTGKPGFSHVAALAAAGRRRNVDLLVSDIYRAGEIPLAGDLTAANFGKLQRHGNLEEVPAPADLASALMGLVGENIALICGGIAAATQVRHIVFGGSTLRENPALVEVLREITRAVGREPIFLAHGEHAGALGALLLAEARRHPSA